MINIQKQREKCQIKNKSTESSIQFRITQLASTSADKFRNLNHKSCKPDPSILKRQYSCEKKVYDRPQSKTVTLFFNENTVVKKKKSYEVLKIVEDGPTEKIYNNRKKNYSKFLKETRVKLKTPAGNSLLNIQSRPLSLINFNDTLFYKDANLITRKRKSKTLNNQNSSYQKTNESHFQEMSVQEAKELSKVEKMAFSSFIGPSKPQNREQMNRIEQKSNIFVRNQKKNQNLVKMQTQQPQFLDKNLQYQSFVPFKKMKEKRKPFTFALFQKQNKINLQNQIKLLNYKDFLWKINYSNALYVAPTQEQHSAFKVYVGFGNNDCLIKNAMKKRFWWSFSQNVEECNFIWTQLKLPSLFTKQKDTKNNWFRANTGLQVDQIGINDVTKKNNGYQKIFNTIDLANWALHQQKNKASERLISQKTYKSRLQFISCKQIQTIERPNSLLVHNHFVNNGYIGNKKALFYNLKKYYEIQGKDVFQIIPLTFHFSKGVQDQQWAHFQKLYKAYQRKKQKGVFQNVWILKPGENSNRGNGITVCYDFEDIRLRLKQKEKNRDGSLRTFILQKYIQRPLLYRDRKFDIRHFIVMSCINGCFKAYWYNEGYIRTSSSYYSLKRGSNVFVHLTNDAIQKNSQDYSKYEPGNKVSYQKFNQYLKQLRNSSQPYFFDMILPQMRKIATEAVKSTFLSLDPNRKMHNFELFGMDYMIDVDLKPWLIEINTNPCLELSSPLLSKIIPTLIEQTIQICVDPLFPPPNYCPSNKQIETAQNLLSSLNFQLIFDQQTQGQPVKSLMGQQMEKTRARIGSLEEEIETFQNEKTP